MAATEPTPEPDQPDKFKERVQVIVLGGLAVGAGAVLGVKVLAGNAGDIPGYFLALAGAVLGFFIGKDPFSKS